MSKDLLFDTIKDYVKYNGDLCDDHCRYLSCGAFECDCRLFIEHLWINRLCRKRCDECNKIFGEK